MGHLLVFLLLVLGLSQLSLPIWTSLHNLLNLSIDSLSHSVPSVYCCVCLYSWHVNLGGDPGSLELRTTP